MALKRSYSFLAELLASLAIVYAACVAICTDRLTEGRLGTVGQAAAVGAVTAAVVTGSARRSPGLGNPAVVLCALWHRPAFDMGGHTVGGRRAYRRRCWSACLARTFSD